MNKNKRNQHYQDFLQKTINGQTTLKEIIDFGAKWMAKEKLHHHFFGEKYSLTETATALSFFALNLPFKLPLNFPLNLAKEEYDNPVNLQRKLSYNEAKSILMLFEKRIHDRIPVEYLTHEANYLGYSFYVNENVLVPRSIMNTRFKDFLEDIQWENFKVLDLCCGSGCIGITLALLNNKITVDLSDISTQALEVANINIKRYQLESRVKTYQSNIFQNIHDKYDLIISNPPYVTEKEYEKSPAEFKREPEIALKAGKDGLDVIHHILLNAKDHLNPNGVIILEVGVTAAKRLKNAYPKLNFEWLKYRKPNGKVSFFALDCILKVHARDLK